MNKKHTLKEVPVIWLRFLLLLAFGGFFLSCSYAQKANSSASAYILENENLTISLGKDKPLIYQYRLKQGEGLLLGDVRDTGPGISFYQDGDQVVSNWTKVVYRSARSGNSVTYHAQASYAGKEAVGFDLVYTLTTDGLRIEFNNVTERDGFYLIHVLLPGLIAVKADGDMPKLAIGADAGRLIDVVSSSPKDYEYEIDWLNPVLSQFAYTSKAIGIVDTESIENHSIASVFEHDGAKYGSVSMKLMHRLMEYDLEEFGPVVAVVDPKNLLKVQDSCSVTISVAADYDNDGEVSWVDGTKVVREKVKAVPNPHYSDKVFVRTFVDRPPTRRDTQAGERS